MLDPSLIFEQKKGQLAIRQNVLSCVASFHVSGGEGKNSHLVSTSKHSLIGYEVLFIKGQCFLDIVRENKVVSDFKYCLDYCEEPASSLNYCFLAQIELTEKRPDLNFFERLLDFSQQHII